LHFPVALHKWAQFLAGLTVFEPAARRAPRGDRRGAWHARHTPVRARGPGVARARQVRPRVDQEGKAHDGAVRDQQDVGHARRRARDARRLPGGRVFHCVQARSGCVQAGRRGAGAARGPRALHDRRAGAPRAARGALARAVPKLAPRRGGAAQVRRGKGGARAPDAHPRRAREGGAVHDDHKEEEKERGEGAGGEAHRVRRQHAVGRPGRAVPAQVGDRDRLQAAKADAHAHAGQERERQDLLLRAVSHGAQRVDHAALGQEGGRRQPPDPGEVAPAPCPARQEKSRTAGPARGGHRGAPQARGLAL